MELTSDIFSIGSRGLTQRRQIWIFPPNETRSVSVHVVPVPHEAVTSSLILSQDTSTGTVVMPYTLVTSGNPLDVRKRPQVTVQASGKEHSGYLVGLTESTASLTLDGDSGEQIMTIKNYETISTALNNASLRNHYLVINTADDGPLHVTYLLKGLSWSGGYCLILDTTNKDGSQTPRGPQADAGQRTPRGTQATIEILRYNAKVQNTTAQIFNSTQTLLLDESTNSPFKVEGLALESEVCMDLFTKVQLPLDATIWVYPESGLVERGYRFSTDERLPEGQVHIYMAGQDELVGSYLSSAKIRSTSTTADLILTESKDVIATESGWGVKIPIDARLIMATRPITSPEPDEQTETEVSWQLEAGQLFEWE